MATARGLSYEEQERLFRGIEAGDADVIAEAQRVSAQLAKRANVRLSALEEKGYNTYAAKRARFELGEQFGRDKFSESKKLDPADLMDQLEIVNNFLNEKSSLVSVEKEKREKAALQGLEESGIVPEDTTSAHKRELLRFLRSDIFKEIKQTYLGTKGGTGGYLISAVDAIENGAKVRDLERMYSEYKEQTGGEVSAEELLDVWLEID